MVEASKNIEALSWSEKVSLCEGWKQSGLSKSKYSRQAGINPNTFYGWCHKVWPASNQSPIKVTPNAVGAKSESWLPVSLTDVDTEGLSNNRSQVTLELKLKNSPDFTVSGPLSEIALLLKELSNGA